MLQQRAPEDFVLGSGETHEVREFVELAFKYAGLELQWYGTGVEEKGMDKSSGKNASGSRPRVLQACRGGDPSFKPRNGQEQAWLVSGSGLCRPC